MSAPQDGGPAFPVADTYYPDGQVQYGTTGMTLRDWFAGQALASNQFPVTDGICYVSDTARLCYELADAMLTARERKEDAK